MYYPKTSTKSYTNAVDSLNLFINEMIQECALRDWRQNMERSHRRIKFRYRKIGF